MTKKLTGLTAITGEESPIPVLVTVHRKWQQGETLSLTAHVTKTGWMRLQQLAMDEATSVQPVVCAEISRIFADHGLPSI